MRSPVSCMWFRAAKGAGALNCSLGSDAMYAYQLCPCAFCPSLSHILDPQGCLSMTGKAWKDMLWFITWSVFAHQVLSDFFFLTAWLRQLPKPHLGAIILSGHYFLHPGLASSFSLCWQIACFRQSLNLGNIQTLRDWRNVKTPVLRTLSRHNNTLLKFNNFWRKLLECLSK